jgi:hypothetical protein
MFRAGLWIQFVMAIWLVVSAFLGVGFWALVVGVAAFVGCVSMVSSNAMAVILDEFRIWRARHLRWRGRSASALALSWRAAVDGDV